MGSGAKSGRLLPVDRLRGLIIILMALDHATYFVALQHPSGEHWGGPFPVYREPLHFLVRLVTHPVAPGFFFLMGVGMALFARSRREAGWSEAAIGWRFVMRGFLLAALQFLVVNRAWEMGPSPFPRIYVGVLFALGGCMILGSLLLRFRAEWLLLLSLVLFVGTEVSHPDPGQWGQNFFHPLGLLSLYSGGSFAFWSNYPILPWMELVTLGMAFGIWLGRAPSRAYRRALMLGLVLLVGFVVLRAGGGFGNIRPRPGSGWINFLNPVKYPPSMTFTLMTMGVDLVLLWLLAKATGRMARWLHPLITFGRVPLFAYVLHLFIFAALRIIVGPGGTGIPAMVPNWILGMLLLIPSARWYADFKRRQPLQSLLRLL